MRFHINPATEQNGHVYEYKFRPIPGTSRSNEVNPFGKSVGDIKDSLMTDKPSPIGRFMTIGNGILNDFPEKEFTEFRATKVLSALTAEKRARDYFVDDSSERFIHPLPHVTVSNIQEHVNDDLKVASADELWKPLPPAASSRPPTVEVHRIKTGAIQPARSPIHVLANRESFSAASARSPVCNREGFTSRTTQPADYVYIETLKNIAMATCKYLQSNAHFRKWKENWELLEKRLNNNQYKFGRLSDNDGDIAYVIDKGAEIKFRIRDKARYLPLNVYIYVLFHEMAHLSTNELQHTDNFHRLLSLLTLAGFLLHYIDIGKIPSDYYRTNGAPIINAAALREELIDGCELVIKANNDASVKEFYNSIVKYVSRHLH